MVIISIINQIFTVPPKKELADVNSAVMDMKLFYIPSKFIQLSKIYKYTHFQSSWWNKEFGQDEVTKTRSGGAEMMDQNQEGEI